MMVFYPVRCEAADEKCTSCIRQAEESTVSLADEGIRWAVTHVRRVRFYLHLWCCMISMKSSRGSSASLRRYYRRVLVILSPQYSIMHGERTLFSFRGAINVILSASSTWLRWFHPLTTFDCEWVWRWRRCRRVKGIYFVSCTYISFSFTAPTLLQHFHLKFIHFILIHVISPLLFNDHV